VREERNDQAVAILAGRGARDAATSRRILHEVLAEKGEPLRTLETCSLVPNRLRPIPEPASGAHDPPPVAGRFEGAHRAPELEEARHDGMRAHKPPEIGRVGANPIAVHPRSGLTSGSRRPRSSSHVNHRPYPAAVSRRLLGAHPAARPPGSSGSPASSACDQAFWSGTGHSEMNMERFDGLAPTSPTASFMDMSL